MQREIDLEDLDEYFLMSVEDRLVFLDDIEERLNAWQPRMRFYIENILKFSNNPKYRNHKADEGAVELIRRCANQEPIHVLRREFSKEDSPERTNNLVILIEAIARNCHIDFVSRYTTIKFYINNPRYYTNSTIGYAITSALDILQYELEEFITDIQIAKRTVVT